MTVGYFFLGAFLGLVLYASDARAFTLMVVGGLLAALIAQVSALTQRLRQFEQQRRPDLDANPSPERPYIVPAVPLRAAYSAANPVPANPVSASPVPPPARTGVIPGQVDAAVPVNSQFLKCQFPRCQRMNCRRSNHHSNYRRWNG